MNFRCFFLLLSVLFIPWLFMSFKLIDGEWRRIEISGETQGTTYRIVYYAKDKIVTKKQVDSLLSGIDQSLSVYQSNATISKFNQSSKGVASDFYLSTVVKESKKITKATGGLFDITVYPLMQAWGFYGKGFIPDSSAISSIMKYVGSDKIFIKNKQLIKTNPAVKIDVNGIAQGYSVDLVADFMKKKNVKNYLVEIGGELRIAGKKKPSNQLFTVGIEAPSENPEDAQIIKRIMKISSGAITTSGNYRNFIKNNGQKLSHLLDATTGYSIHNELISVTVFAKKAILADGYDNALMAMGLKKGLDFVNKHKGIEAYFIYHHADGLITDTCTLGFKKMLFNDHVE